MLKGRILHILKTSSLIVVFACLLGAILWWLPNVLSYETNTTKDWVVSKGASSSENSYVKLSEVEARIKIDAQNGENVNYAAAPVYSPPLSTNSSSLSSSQLYESSAVTMHSLGGGTMQSENTERNRTAETSQKSYASTSVLSYRNGQLAQATPDAQANGWTVVDGHANILESGNETDQGTMQKIKPPSYDDPVLPLADGLPLLLLFSLIYICIKWRQ